MRMNEIPEWNEKITKMRYATGNRWGSQKIRMFNERDVIFRRYNHSMRTGWDCRFGVTYNKVKGVFVKFAYKEEDNYFHSISNFLSYTDDAIADHISQINYLRKLKKFVADKEKEIEENNAVDAL